MKMLWIVIMVFIVTSCGSVKRTRLPSEIGLSYEDVTLLWSVYKPAIKRYLEELDKHVPFGRFVLVQIPGAFTFDGMVVKEFSERKSIHKVVSANEVLAVEGELMYEGQRVTPVEFKHGPGDAETQLIFVTIDRYAAIYWTYKLHKNKGVWEVVETTL